MGNISQAFDGQAFDSSQYKDQEGFEFIPAGEYILEVKAGEVKETGNKKGLGAEMRFEIMDGELAGSGYRQWYNLRHENEQAGKIGQQQFASLLKACGVPLCQDTDELLGKRFIGKIGAQKKDPTSNEFKNYRALDGQAPAPAARPAAAPPQSTPATSAKKMPWQR